MLAISSAIVKNNTPHAILTLFTLLVCLSLSVQPDHEDQGVSEVAPFFVAPVPHTILQKFQVSRT